MIIQDGLPKDCYDFQRNALQPRTPRLRVFTFPTARPLVIDAKFPLEAVTAFREAGSDEERKLAIAACRAGYLQAYRRHLGEYLIPGETQDIALMFMPSEIAHAELYERFEDLIQRAHRAKVTIVSPTLMVLADPGDPALPEGRQDA